MLLMMALHTDAELGALGKGHLQSLDEEQLGRAFRRFILGMPEDELEHYVVSMAELWRHLRAKPVDA